jgi:hypothetical protein
LDRHHDDRGAWPAGGQPISGQGGGDDVPRLSPLRVDLLLPFIAGPPASLWTSTLMTGVTFFSIGSLRSHWSPAPWWKAGLETFLIGITTAFVAYLVGVILSGLVSGAG